jgi:OOP family OmpA-OmpF porin
MRREKNTAAAVIAVAILATPSLAAAQEASSYFGASLGMSQARKFCNASDAPAGSSTSSCDDHGVGFKLFLGYRFNKFLAVEGSFITFGDFATNVTVGSETARAEFNPKAWSGAGLLIVPLGDRLELFGKAGMAAVKSERQTTVGGASFTLGKDRNEPIYGLGLSYGFGRPWSLRAEWERISDSKVDFFSVGAQYRF